jgi:rod shape-determining protein MreC
MTLQRRTSPARFSHRLSQHRTQVILFVLVALSALSLVTGTEATILHRGIERTVEITAWPFLEARHHIASSTRNSLDFVFDYHALQGENTELGHEVVRLKESIARFSEVAAENQRLRGMLNFLRDEPRLSLSAVTIVESYRGMLTIDRGSLHGAFGKFDKGIQKSMGVITPQGVVGIVTEVGDFTSKVASLHHTDCKIGVMVQRQRIRAYDGVIHASTDSMCMMEYIDMKNEVRQGDRVVTSPESVFPGGYPVGLIVAPPDGFGSLWKTAEVTPFVDPYRLDEVFVIYQAAPATVELAGSPTRSEFEEARASDTAHNQAVSRAPELPDSRSIQERFAP